MRAGFRPTLLIGQRQLRFPAASRQLHATIILKLHLEALADMTVGVFFIRALTFLFFTGLAGCCVVVLLSWISIFGSEFSRQSDKDSGDDHPLTHPSQSTSHQNRPGYGHAFSESRHNSTR